MKAVPSLLIVLLPTYSTIGLGAPALLLFIRVIGGVAKGVNVGETSAFISEHAERQRTGFAIGLLACAMNSGILLGFLMAIGLTLVFTPRQIIGGAWRFLFLLGGIFELTVGMLRHWSSGTELFRQTRLPAEGSRGLSLRILFRHYKTAVLSALGGALFLTTTIALVVLMPSSLLQRAFVFPCRTTLSANLAGAVALGVSFVIFGTATDRFGIRRLVAPGVFCLIVATYGLYLSAQYPRFAQLPIYIFAGLAAGIVVLAPILAVRTFPPFIRDEGLSFSYEVGCAVFWGLTPLIASGLAFTDPLGPANCIAVVALVGAISMLVSPTASNRVALHTEITR
jgi:MFS family permease